MMRLLCACAIIGLATTAADQPLTPRLQAQNLLQSSDVTWAVIGPYQEGTGRCRTTGSSDGTPGGDYNVNSDSATVQACKTACEAQSTCVAIGFTDGSCQLWSNVPSTSANVESSSCLRKVVVATGTALCGDNHFAQLGLGQSRSVSALHNVPVSITSAAFGNYHSLFLDDATNKVYAAGNNLYGQLGLNDQTQRSVPTQIPLSYTVKMVVAGGAHSIIITTNGQALTFGRNSHGQLCNNERGGLLSVPQLLPVSNIKSASAGFAHTIFTTNSDTLLGCGNNKDGELGMGNFDEVLVPTAIPSISHVVDVAAGAKHTLVLTALQGGGGGGMCGVGDRETLSPASHTYTSEGSNSYYPCPDGNYIDASCGHVGMSRSVFGSLTVDMGSPVSVGGVVVQGSSIPTAVWSTSVEVFVKASSGDAFTSMGTFAISVANQNEKFVIEFPSMTTAQAIKVAPLGSSQSRRSATIRLGVWTCESTYEVKSFGSNAHGQLGMTTGTPATPENVPLSGFDGNPSAIAAGQSHSVVALSSGKVVVFGFNFYGQLGLPSRGSVASDIQDETTPTYMELPAGKLASQIAAGSHHTIVQMTDDTVYGVGRNYDGQLGTGSESDAERGLAPVAVPFTPAAVVAGGGVSLVLQ